MLSVAAEGGASAGVAAKAAGDPGCWECAGVGAAGLTLPWAGAEGAALDEAGGGGATEDSGCWETAGGGEARSVLGPVGSGASGADGRGAEPGMDAEAPVGAPRRRGRCGCDRRSATDVSGWLGAGAGGGGAGAGGGGGGGGSTTGGGGGGSARTGSWNTLDGDAGGVSLGRLFLRLARFAMSDLPAARRDSRQVSWPFSTFPSAEPGNNRGRLEKYVVGCSASLRSGPSSSAEPHLVRVKTGHGPRFGRVGSCTQA
jgi:hypothetical protein